MNEPQELTTIMNNLDGITTEANPQNMVKAYLLAYNIQEGKRFFEYFNESTAKSPTPLVLDYMRSIGAPAISTISANNIKDVLFHDIDRNKHKTALLKGVAQAYFDVCLFLGIASICTEQQDLNYAEAACLVEKSLTELEKGYNRVCDLLSPMKWSDDLTDFEQVASGTISFAKLRERFKHSVSIIQMYQNDRVRYNQSYDSIVESVAIYRQAEIWMTLNNKYIVTALHIVDSPKSNVTQKKVAKELVKIIGKSKTLSSLFDNSVEPVTTEEFMIWVDCIEIPEVV